MSLDGIPGRGLDAGVDSIRLDDKGLIAAVAQDRLTGEVRMVGWMNLAAVERTLATGRATFFSRSRQTLWEKGETSGNGLLVHSIGVDCDADTLLLLVRPEGPTCHTGRPSCFFRQISESGEVRDGEVLAAPFLLELERVIEARQLDSVEKSYTKRLLEGGPSKIAEKIVEEAQELRQALSSESDERVKNEAADVIFHVLVGLRARGLSLASVIEVLVGRAGTSGLEEKAARPQISKHSGEV